MNNRDPFALRPLAGPAIALLHTTAARVAQETTHKVAAGGKQVLAEAQATMSAYAPSAQQNGWPTQRHPDMWPPAVSQSHYNVDADAQPTLAAGLSEKVGGFFGADRREELPMYKDKPAGRKGAPYGGRRRRGAWFLQRRTVAIVLSSLAAISWWFGILSPLSWFTRGGERRAPAASTWEARAEEVRETFRISFKGYEKFAWGYDEFHPVSQRGQQMTQSGMGWIIVDALDTMMLMNLTDELEHSRQWIHDSLHYDQDHDVNTFETTIRMLGGLLSAHYLSTQFDGVYAPVKDTFGPDLYIEKATDLADRLLGAYNSQSGVPFASVNLHTMQGIQSHADGGASSTAEATSLQLEMKYLSKLTGEDLYWDKAERVMEVIDDNAAEDALVPIFIHADSGHFRGEYIRLGSRGDSYYEYLIKQYLQTSEEEPVYQAMWNESLAGIKKHLITYSYPDNFTFIAEKPQGLGRDLLPKMDHLVCFMPGTIALATTGGLPLAQARNLPSWGPQQEEDMKLAAELMNTCWGMYMASPTGLAGEITHFHLHEPPLMYNDYASHPRSRPHSPRAFDRIEPGHEFAGRDDFVIKAGDAHNLQRPETVESLFYLWRITGDEKYREWGWKMFSSFVKWTALEDGSGFSSINSVLEVPPGLRDNMESFWLAETLKYFYLLFSPDTILPLTDVVFNTEAHPFPRFPLGKLFSTGWERKARDQDGKIVAETAHERAAAAAAAAGGAEAGGRKTVTLANNKERESATATPGVGAEATPPSPMDKAKEEGTLDPVSGKVKEV